MVLGDRFVSFKVDGDRRDGDFFFYRAVHDYCFLPCMWPQVIDLFPSKQAGIARMAVSFSIARCMIIVSFHACGLR